MVHTAVISFVSDSACGALLLRARAEAIIEGVEVKCRKCRRLVVIHQRAARSVNPSGAESPAPERHGASPSERRSCHPRRQT